jgi:hypothetical protein
MEPQVVSRAFAARSVGTKGSWHFLQGQAVPKLSGATNGRHRRVAGR